MPQSAAGEVVMAEADNRGVDLLPIQNDVVGAPASAGETLVALCEACLSGSNGNAGPVPIATYRGLFDRVDKKRRLGSKTRPMWDLCPPFDGFRRSQIGSHAASAPRRGMRFGPQSQTLHGARRELYKIVKVDYAQTPGEEPAVPHRGSHQGRVAWRVFLADLRYLSHEDMHWVMGTHHAQRSRWRRIRSRFESRLRLRFTTRVQAIREYALEAVARQAPQHDGMHRVPVPGDVVLGEAMQHDVRVFSRADVVPNGYRLKYKPAMTLTWNGSWLRSDETFHAHMREAVPDACTDEAAAALPCVEALCATFSDWFAQRLSFLAIPGLQWSWCLERSVSSHPARVHFHAYVNAPMGQFERDHVYHMLRLGHWRWGAVQPHVNAMGQQVSFRQSLLLVCGGHVYMQLRKYGRIAGDSNFRAFQDFIVAPHLIWRLWQLRKMSTAAAREGILRTRDTRMVQLLGCMKEIQEEERSAVEDAHMTNLLARLEAQSGRSRSYPIVDAWLSQFAVLEDPTRGRLPRRFKFLVLNGPSQCGKTVFAQRLFGWQHTLMVDCQGTSTPSIRAFNRSIHKAIVYDELSDAGILQNKKLFQSGVDVNELGQSVCNMHAYKRWTYGTAMIISTNTWLTGALRDCDREWLLCNSMVLQVEGPMWLPPEPNVAPV